MRALFDLEFWLAMAYIFCLTILFWMFWCLHKTMLGRLRIIESARFRPMTGIEILGGYERITFGQHFLAVLLRRDPLALYEPVVQDAVKNPKSEVICGVMEIGEGGPTPPKPH